ncbi:hypothetical protein F5H01DRAFT_23437 [Linnemannia elongata]|nr:hypothetical protein F5H01DRAFT_23437 [Linnemannia elongata]
MSVPHRQAPMHLSTHSFMQHSAPSAQPRLQDHSNNVRLLLSSPLTWSDIEGYLFPLYFTTTTPGNSRDVWVCVYFERTSFPVPVPKIMGYLISSQVPMKKQETHTLQTTWKARNVHEKGCRITPIHLLSLLLQSSFVHIVVILLCSPRLPTPFFTFSLSLFPTQSSPFSPSHSLYSSFFFLLLSLPLYIRYAVLSFLFFPSQCLHPLSKQLQALLSYLSSDRNIIPLSSS